MQVLASLAQVLKRQLRAVNPRNISGLRGSLLIAAILPQLSSFPGLVAEAVDALGREVGVSAGVYEGMAEAADGGTDFLSEGFLKEDDETFEFRPSQHGLKGLRDNEEEVVVPAPRWKK